MREILIAVNGFGRIGRAAFKIAMDRPEIKIMAINDLANPETLAHLLRHDTIYGSYENEVKVEAGHLIVKEQRVKIFNEKVPTNLPWKKMGIEVVLECSGHFVEREAASNHLKAGAKKVIISAPSEGNNPAPTYVLGVNHQKIKNEETVISNGSCTTNCIAPISKIIQDEIGIKKAMMTTIHSYTADQNLHDGAHKDLRRARAASVNIVPTTTGATVSASEVVPELKGLFRGMAIRVPTPIVSLSDFTILTQRKTTEAEVNDFFIEASKKNSYKGILEVSNEPLVSSDLIKNPASAIIDLSLTKVIDGDMVKIIAWYDNEWGYANRLVEMISIFS